MIILFLMLFSLHAGAQSLCPEEQRQFCADQKDPAELTKCLILNKDKLSITCKQQLERIIQMREDAEGRGGGSLSAFGGLNAFGPALPLLAYDGRWSSNLNEHKGNLSMPIYKEEGRSLAFSVAGGQLYFDRPLVLDNGKKVSSTWSRYELGLQYSKFSRDKRSWGVRGSLGYAGDKPFYSDQDLTYSFIGSYGYPSVVDDKGYWTLLVFMSNNSGFFENIPLPGVVYFYRRADFTGVFGFPMLSAQWTPKSPWAYSLSIFGLNAQGEVSYGYRNRLQFFAGYNFVEQSYMPYVREHRKDRLKLQEQKLFVGARTPLSKQILAEVKTGHSYSRSVYSGQGLFNKDHGSLKLPEDWFATLGIKVLL